MKRVIFFSILLIVLLISIGYIIYNNGENLEEDSFSIEIYNKYNNVDDGIDKLVNSEEYKLMSESERVKSVGHLLKLYELSRVIKNVSYDDDNKLYSFEYSSGELDGTLGGVMIKQFNSMFN